MRLWAQSTMINSVGTWTDKMLYTNLPYSVKLREFKNDNYLALSVVSDQVWKLLGK